MSAQVRSEIVEFLRRELIGPDPGYPAQQLNREEILRPQDPPRLRYSAGVLFPRRATVAIAETATETEAESDGVAVPEGEGLENEDTDTRVGDHRADARGEGEIPTDQEVNRANEYLPSAMGISALVRVPKKLQVSIAAAFYERIVVPGLGRPDKDDKWQSHLFRRPINCALELDCRDYLSAKPVIREFPVRIGDADTFLVLHVYSRPHLRAERPDSDRIIIFTLLNNRTSQAQRPRDDECFFQCGFTVSDHEGRPCFLEYPDRAGTALDKEEQSQRLLFSHQKTFAVGHGCAANWRDEAGSMAATIRTESLPAYEIKPIVPRQVKNLELAMEALAFDGETPISLCRRLAEEYDRWIAEREDEVELIAEEQRPAARRHLKGCRDALTRISGGIDLLGSDETVRRAFSLMNRAMLSQQFHYELSSNPEKRRKWDKKGDTLVLEKPYSPPDLSNLPPGRGRWRPFQLAFILMNLRSMSERDSEDRQVVDLIWFPTGGGKTEAYLGLKAFTIFWRRLDNPENDGTTALMRYTLRLLTTQQYQRAASLICACEKLRRGNTDDLGETPISIGLWVGGEVTPIHHDDAVKKFQELLGGRSRENPFIMLSCPWCGAQIGPVELGNSNRVKGYRQLSNPKRVEFCCDDPD